MYANKYHYLVLLHVSNNNFVFKDEVSGPT